MLQKLIAIGLLTAIVTNLCGQKSCPNGGAEYGDFTNWQGRIGTNVGGSAYLPTTGIYTNRHEIVTPGPDPIIGPALNQVDAGSYAIRLGNSINGAQAESLMYTFTVDGSNQNFS